MVAACWLVALVATLPEVRRVNDRESEAYATEVQRLLSLVECQVANGLGATSGSPGNAVVTCLCQLIRSVGINKPCSFIRAVRGGAISPPRTVALSEPDASHKAVMQQIKLFKGVENDLAALEAGVNTWLAETGVDVVHIFGNIAPQTPGVEVKSGGLSRSDFAPSDVLLVIHYRTPG